MFQITPAIKGSVVGRSFSITSDGEVGDVGNDVGGDDILTLPPCVALLLPSSVTVGFASYLIEFESVSSENITFDFVLIFLIAVISFWTASGTIYPNNFIVNVDFTVLSLPLSNVVTKSKESILALNLNLSGSPQYESEA